MIIEMEYSVKHDKSGIGRLFINASHLLKSVGFKAGTQLTTVHLPHRIEIYPDPAGRKSVIRTRRGELIELRDKSTGKSLKGLRVVKVRFESNKLVISARPSDLKQMEREASIIANVKEGVITKASLCSGIGLTALKISEGLKKHGFSTDMLFSNEKDSLALAVQIEGNPIWHNARKNAMAINSDIRDLELEKLPAVNIVEVGYPCNGQSKLSPKHRRDVNHPEVGTLFIQIINALRALNPAVIIFENTPAFNSSKTLELIERELSEYKFEKSVIDGHKHGDIEGRERSCVIAVSSGLPEMDLSKFEYPDIVIHRELNTYLDNVADEDKSWGTKPHIKRKLTDPRLNFKLNVYKGNETKIASLLAGNQSPKINSPFIAHSSFDNTGLMRLINPLEHARIRELPAKMMDLIEQIVSGTHALISTRGSSSAAHRLLGNCPSPKAWTGVGEFLGRYLRGMVAPL
ncbi:DNA cytosine methyltransferase [Vibrio vulnificus]|uniref:DNA cytosine methyltransferase n=1 Tax=Vibrio vulnificus TaxID=672 RepID=UPI00405A10D1